MQRSIIVLLAIVLAFASTSAYGQATFDSNNLLDGFPRGLMDGAQNWESTFASYAHSLFWTLAVIEIVICAAWLALSGGTLEAWFSELVRRIMFIGFFAFILTIGPDLVKEVRNNFVTVSGNRDGLRLSDLFDMGLRLAELITSNLEWWNQNSQASGVVLGLCAVLIVVSFAILTAILLIILLEATIGLSVGMFLLGFGGTAFTKDIAVKYLVFAVAISLKVLVAYLIADLGTDLLFRISVRRGLTDTFIGPVAISGLAIVIAMVAYAVPKAIQKMVMGVAVPRSGSAFQPAPPAPPVLQRPEPVMPGSGSGGVWKATQPAGNHAHKSRFNATESFRDYNAPTSTQLGLANSKLNNARSPGARPAAF